MTTATIEQSGGHEAQAPPLASRWLRQGLTALALIALADWLFYREGFGISLLVFALALAIATLVANPIVASWRRVGWAMAVLAIGFLPIIEDCSALSILFAWGSAAVFALMTSDVFARPIQAQALRTAAFLISGPARLVQDWTAAYGSSDVKAATGRHAGALMTWVLPITFGAVFVWLFAAANPVLEGWLRQLDLERVLDAISLPRIAFWVGICMAIWSFVSSRAAALFPVTMPKIEAAGFDSITYGRIFGFDAILRSLIVFNALFALQTAMDAGFLWGGLSLPNGMTYAAYAHRGAYPLIVTALLAGGFVLVAMQPGSKAEGSRLMRALVFAWIAQNVLLVLSSIQRLSIYVDVYHLTYWRIAAFIWMGLVAAGLVWLIVRILGRRSNAWLLSANLWTLVATLYACCFINFPSQIAHFNMSHNQSAGSSCTLFDANYLTSLGPEIVPALDQFKGKMCPLQAASIGSNRLSLVLEHRIAMSNWRAWSFRGSRLQTYLNRTPPG
jgi:hypothetical protein